MLPGSYDQVADVRELTTYVLLDGVRVDIESLSLDRELNNDLPAQVVGGAGLGGGSGTVVWANQAEVTLREASPWYENAQWPPRPGARVRVYVTDGTTSWPRFTGLIDRTRGTVGGAMTSELIDYRDRLNVMYTSEALLQRLPPVRTGTEYRLIGLRFWHFLAQALRRAGIYNVPPAGNYSFLNIPLQGSGISQAGRTVECQGETDQNTPNFHTAPWGYSVGEIHARYEADGIIPGLSEVLQVGFMVAPDHAGTAHIRFLYGANPDRRIRIRVRPDRRVDAFWHNTLVVTLGHDDMRDAHRVMLLVKGSTWTLRTETGREQTGTQERFGSQQVSEVQLDTDHATRIAGIAADSPTSDREWMWLNFTPTATFEPSNLVGQISMSPRLENRNLASLVDDICSATLTAAWFDESGIFRMVPSDRLYARSTTQTITSLDDVLALSWEMSMLHTRSAVQVEWQSASISISRERRQELYRGNGATLDTGDTVEVFATPSRDEEWFDPNRTPERLDDSNWGRANTPIDSVMGVHYSDDDGERPTSTTTATTTITAEPIGTVGVKVVHQAGFYQGKVEGNLKVSEEDTRLRESRKGENLPIIRGRGHGQWVDETTTRTISGPEAFTFPELDHQLGPWGSASAAANIADFLADRVDRVEPTIPSFRVVFDPRRQLGDMVTIRLGILDVSLRALVVGISEDHQKGKHSQELTVRILDATSTRKVAYTELETAWQGGDYNALQAVWEGLSHSDFEADPLRFAPQPETPSWSPPSAAKYSLLAEVWQDATYDEMQADVTGETYGTFSQDLTKGEYS